MAANANMTGKSVFSTSCSSISETRSGCPAKTPPWRRTDPATNAEARNVRSQNSRSEVWKPLSAFGPEAAAEAQGNLVHSDPAASGNLDTSLGSPQSGIG